MVAPHRERTGALIDVGSTSVSLWVATAVGGEFVTEHQEKELLRLGAAQDSSGSITGPKLDAFIELLLRYRKQLVDLPLRIVATASLRDVANRLDIQGRVQRELGVPLEILSGEEEASAAYRGAGLATPSREPRLVVDVGGGSTELAWGAGVQPERVMSLPIGVVRLQKAYGLVSGARLESLSAATDWLRGHLAGLPSAPGKRAIACSGTMKRLIGLVEGRFPPSWDASLDRNRLDRLWKQLLGCDESELLALPGLDPDRADLLLAGAFVFRVLSDELGVDHWSLTSGGLRWGLMDALLCD